jgi:hypothetical protein
MYELIALTVIVGLLVAVWAFLKHVTRAPGAPSPRAAAPRPDFRSEEELEQWLKAKDKQYGGGRFS